VLAHLYFHTKLDDPTKESPTILGNDHCTDPNYCDDDVPVLPYSETKNAFAFVRKCDSDKRVLQIGITNCYTLDRYPDTKATVPATVGELSRLEDLSLKYFTVGSIPSTIGLLTDLYRLRIGLCQKDIFDRAPNGEGLTGAIPTEIGNLSSLRFLNLSNNELTDELPSEIGRLSSLSHIDLDENQMTDPFPSEVSQLSNLKDVNLSGNPLTVIPPEIKTMTGLEILWMSRCSLQGSISGLEFPASIRELNLRPRNQLTGAIPAELKFLKEIDLRDNLLQDDLCKSDKYNGGWCAGYM